MINKLNEWSTVYPITNETNFSAPMTIFQAADMSNPWIFDAGDLDFTPSNKDGITKAQESQFRVAGARFIQILGNEELKLHYSTVATGAVFFQRFYMYYSFKIFPVYPMAATCLFLAGKVEETPKKSNDIIKFSRTILSEEHFAQFGSDPKEEILTLERILLQTLRFDLEVEHPYEHLIRYVKQSKFTQAGQTNDSIHKVILQSAWTLLNDSCCTTICLQYEPEIVAIASIFLSCKTANAEITDWDNRKQEHQNWWDVYVDNLDEKPLENICHLILDVYQYSRTGQQQQTPQS